MKKMIMSGLICLGACMPLQVSAESLLERVVTDVIIGAYDKPQYHDARPYYYYNNRYYYGGEWRDRHYYYQGRRLDGGHYYERGYHDHYKKEKHPNHKNGYYKHNKHYQAEHPHGYYDDKRYYEDSKKNKNNKSHKSNSKHKK